MTFQLIGNDRYKIYLDRIPVRSIRLSNSEIKEISEFNLEYIEALEEQNKVQEYYDDVLGDIEEQAEFIREAEELMSNIKNSKVREQMEDIIESIASAVSGHI